MTILKTDKGDYLDTTTWKLVGRTPEAPTAASARSDVFEQVVPPEDRVPGLIRNATWGLSTGLFTLPDALTLRIGRAIGLNDEEVTTFGKLFNKTATGQAVPSAPRNAEERYARAIFEGATAGLPYTGVLGFFARRMSPIALTNTSTTGVIRGIANDTMNFIKNNPRQAVALDVAIGSTYETLRQAVKENVSDENPYKKLYEDLLPMGAIFGLPAAVKLMPTVQLGQAAKNQLNKLTGASSGKEEIDELGRETYEGLNRVWRLPIINVPTKLLLNNAKGKLRPIFGDVETNPEVQRALQEIESIMADPRFASANFKLNAAEKTMSKPLIARTEELFNRMSSAELQEFNKRFNENQLKFDALLETLAPEARITVGQAFQQAQAERQRLFDDLLLRQKELTDAERASIAERLGPQDISLINGELRGALLGAMEFDYNMRQNVLSRMGLRQAVSPDGTLLPTRENGVSLYPAQDMEAAVTGLLKKYMPERPSARTSLPEPIRLLSSFYQTQKAARDKLERDTLKNIVDTTLADHFAKYPPMDDVTADITKKLVWAAVTGKGIPKSLAKKSRDMLGDISTSKQFGPIPDKFGNVRIYGGSRDGAIIINPKQINEDARLIAEQSTAVNINLPEALDYLASAARFRNNSLASFNKAMESGADRNTAQRIMDTGNAVYKDIEKLILDHVPKIRQEYSGMKNVLADYRSGFEQRLPLLMSQRVGRGDAFLLPNEQLMQQAFKNAQNLAQLQVTMAGNPLFDSLLEKGMIDWLRTKGVVNPDGLVDPKRIRSVLDKNQNIVNALPEGLQQKLTNEVALADDYVARMAELESRKQLVADDELRTLLKNASRPDADPRQALATAIKDPATMRSLVNNFKNDPEKLGALRRSIFDTALEGTQKGGVLEDFITRNEKSLKVLFENTQHFEDLQKLASIQKRISMFADITGQVPPFASLDQTMKNLFGITIGGAATTLRQQASHYISPETALTYFLVRLGGALENKIYTDMFRKALDDPKFAKALTSINSPQSAEAAVAQLQKIGISKGMVRARLMAEENLTQGIIEDIPTPASGLPAMSEAEVAEKNKTAAQMLRALPPAPPTTGYQLRLGTTPPPKPSNSYQNVPLMYPALFPNDPISGLLEQRRQQIQQGQPIQPQVPQ